jgi:hypothetical protein
MPGMAANIESSGIAQPAATRALRGHFRGLLT